MFVKRKTNNFWNISTLLIFEFRYENLLYRDPLISKLDGSFLKMITSLEKNDLIILDDFGLQPMDMNTRLALLQILEERYERKSVIIASQLPIAKWYDYIGDATLADAIMDRLVANANKIELKGESMRQRRKK